MADEIKQVLGIDVTGALKSLQALDQGYLAYQTRVAATAATMNAFNGGSGKTIAALKDITSAANAASKALDKASRAQGTATSGGTSTSGSSAPRSAPKKLLTGADAEAAFDSLLGKRSNEAVKAQLAAERQMIDSYRRIGGAAKKEMGDAEKSTSKLTVSWETLARVVATQLIVRAMSAIRDVLREAVSEAIQFQKQVALITTIADGASFGQIADGVRAISDNFNIPLLEAAQGVYNALSNQVGDFGESLKFTEEAAKFAKATNSSLKDSVDLLSAALRSYGLGVEDTARVSSIFFVAIDKGRVTADQLANSIGRILEPASEIGIELEELAGAVASVSEKGLGTAETLTQFRGIVTALTKPTDAMSEAIRGLGFTSARSAIQTLGLDGVLEQLAKNTNGSAEEFARLFPAVRGLGGALGLTGENLETFVENIRLGREAGDEFANSKFLTATATEGEKLTKALNQISNAFTVELGQALVKGGNDLLEATGGVEAITDNIKEMAKAITFVTGTIADLEKFTGLISTLAKLSPITFFNANQRNNIAEEKKRLEALGEANDKADKARSKKDADRIAELDKNNKEIVQKGRRALQDIGVEYNEAVDKAKRGDKAIVKSAETSLDKIVSLRSKFLQSIEQAIGESTSKTQASQDRIFAIQQGQKDRKFDQNTRDLPDAAKVGALTKRSAELAKEAEETMLAAFRTGNEALQQRGLGLFDKASSTAEEARQIGLSAKNRALEGFAANKVEEVATRQLRVEEQINKAQEQRRQALIKERAEQEKVVEALKEQAQIVLDNSGDFDKNGDRFTDKERAAREARRNEALNKVGKLAFSSKDVKAADFLGLADFTKAFQSDAAKDPIKLVFDVKAGAAQAQLDLQKVFDGVDLKLPFLKGLEDAVGRPLRKDTEDVQKALTELQSQVQELEKRKAAIAQGEANVSESRGAVQALLDELKAAQAEGQKGKQSEASVERNQAIDAAIIKTQDLLKNTKLTKEEVQELENQLSKIDFGRTGTAFSDGKTGPQQQALGFSQALVELRKFQEAQAKTVPLEQVDEAKLEKLRSVIQTIQGSTVDQKAKATSDALTLAAPTAGTLATASLTTAAAYERAAIAIASVQGMTLPEVKSSTQLPATSDGSGVVASNGRHIINPKYMAAGGFMPRGMDTQAVGVRAGESIINPDSTRKFFSQIQAINAGKTPQYRSTGGSTTNVGDISINVNGSESPQATGRAVAAKLRREFRKGSSRL